MLRDLNLLCSGGAARDCHYHSRSIVDIPRGPELAVDVSFDAARVVWDYPRYFGVLPSSVLDLRQTQATRRNTKRNRRT